MVGPRESSGRKGKRENGRRSEMVIFGLSIADKHGHNEENNEVDNEPKFVRSPNFAPAVYAVTRSRVKLRRN